MALQNRKEATLRQPTRSPAQFDQQNMAPTGSYMAAPPQVPPLSEAAAMEEARRHAALLVHEAQERRSLLRGLVLFAIVAIAIAVFRAGLERAFFSGWWRRW